MDSVVTKSQFSTAILHILSLTKNAEQDERTRLNLVLNRLRHLQSLQKLLDTKLDPSIVSIEVKLSDETKVFCDSLIKTYLPATNPERETDLRLLSLMHIANRTKNVIAAEFALATEDLI